MSGETETESYTCRKFKLLSEIFLFFTQNSTKDITALDNVFAKTVNLIDIRHSKKRKKKKPKNNQRGYPGLSECTE